MKAKTKSAFADKKMVGRAIKDSFIKLNPKIQVKNSVMLLVYISAILTTGLWILSLFGLKDASPGYILAHRGYPLVYRALCKLRRSDCRGPRQSPGGFPAGGEKRCGGESNSLCRRQRADYGCILGKPEKG